MTRTQLKRHRARRLGEIEAEAFWRRDPSGSCPFHLACLDQAASPHPGRVRQPQKIQDRRGDVEQVHALRSPGSMPGAGHDQQSILSVIRVVGPVSFSKVWMPSSPPSVPTARQKRSPKRTMRSGGTPFACG